MFKGRDESLDFIGLLEWKCRIYTLFTPLEDWIGIVRIGRREMNLTSFFLDYVSGNRQYEIDFVRLLVYNLQ